MQFPGLKTAIGLRLFSLYRSMQISLHDLTYLFWECTLRCNLNCRHCGSDCRKESAVPDMPVEDFLQVLDEIRKDHNPSRIMLALTGGEPLLRRDLEHCGSQFAKRGFPWGIVTNGFLLTRDRLEGLLEAGMRSITVSLDGMAESHNRLRGNQQSFDKAYEAITLCSRADGLNFDVVTCVHDKNLLELSELKDTLVGLGVRKWRLFTIFPKGRSETVGELNLESSKFVCLLDFISACREEGKVEVSYGCEGFLGPYEGKVRKGYFFCRAGVSIGSVLADGSISACPSLRDDFVQGNIYTDSFTDCWENRYATMRDRSWARTGPCRDCREFKWCNGNGLHLRTGTGRELLTCHHQKIREGVGRVAGERQDPW